MKSLITRILAAAFLVLFLYSGWHLCQIFIEYRTADAQYDKLGEYVSAPGGSLSDSTPAAEEKSECPQVDFDALSKINPETVGWLIIEDTGINYPVVQGADNEFYLKHQFDGRYNSSGCLFLDVKNDASFQEFNQIIYGHYMNNQSMFSDLVKYKDQEFFDAHPAGWLVTPSAAYRLQFFSGYVSDVLGDAWDTEFSAADYPQWLRKCQEQSIFTADTVPDAEDRVLTLSTCSYEFPNARFVLHAVLQTQCPDAAGIDSVPTDNR